MHKGSKERRPPVDLNDNTNRNNIPSSRKYIYIYKQILYKLPIYSERLNNSTFQLKKKPEKVKVGFVLMGLLVFLLSPNFLTPLYYLTDPHQLCSG